MRKMFFIRASVFTLLWLYFLTGAVAQESAPIKPTGSFYGLVIGESDYKNPKLQLDRPAKDAQRLRDILISRYTFDDKNIKLLSNPTRQQIIAELYNLRKTITSNDNLLIFYAGHGYWDDQASQGYWWPSDAAVDEPSNWLSNSDLKEQIRGIKSAHTLLISDACFSGGIFKTRSAAEAIKSSSLNIQMLYKMPSRRAMTSGTLTTVPDESVFFSYLVKRLNDNTESFLPSQDLFNSLKQAVINNSLVVPQDGVIAEAGDEGGDFIFILKDVSATSPTVAVGGAPADATKVTRGIVPPTADELIDKGKESFGNKNYEDALSAFTSAIGLDASNAPAYSNRGRVYFNMKKYGMAIADYTTAIGLKTNYTWAYYLRGLAKQELHKNNDAIADFSKAIEIDPRYSYAYNMRGFAELELKQNDLAAADFTKALQLDVKLAAPYNGLGIVMIRQEKLDDAIANFNIALQINPKFASPLSNRGWAELKQGKLAEARKDLQAALELDPKSHNAWNHLGMVEIKENQTDKGIADFSKAIEISPKNLDAYINRARALNSQKQTDKAMADITRVLDAAPKNADALALKDEILKNK